MDFWLSTLALLIVATVAAYLGYRFNRRLMESNHQWEEHRHLIISGEKFCDELLEHVARYKQTNSSDVRAEILSGRIHVSVQLMAQLIKEHFPGDNNMKRLFGAAIVTITNYRMTEVPPDQSWIVQSTGVIIELRFAFLGAKPACDSFER